MPPTSRFATTRWSLIQAAAPESPECKRALAELCELYWYPLYSFVRRQGHGAEEALDLTQGFFAGFLEREDVTKAEAERGRFRCYLMVAMKHFLANQHDHREALKRGGGRQILSLDTNLAESRYATEPVDGWSPERLFERRWALQILQIALDRLREEYVAKDREALFNRIRPLLEGTREVPYREIAGHFDLSEGAVKVTVHRCRRRFGELLREEVASTLKSPDTVDQEIQWLREALG